MLQKKHNLKFCQQSEMKQFPTTYPSLPDAMQQMPRLNSEDETV